RQLVAARSFCRRAHLWPGLFGPGHHQHLPARYPFAVSADAAVPDDDDRADGRRGPRDRTRRRRRALRKTVAARMSIAQGYVLCGCLSAGVAGVALLMIYMGVFRRGEAAELDDGAAHIL